MEKQSDWFKSQMLFLKVVAMQPIAFSASKSRVLDWTANFVFSIFWHFVVIHLAVFQTRTIILNLDKSLDEFIDYVMIGSIYIFGYMILCFLQFNSTKLLKLMEFARQNFRLRSAKGELSSSFFLRAFLLPILSGSTFVAFGKSVAIASKYCQVWVYVCLAGTLSWIVYPLVQCFSCKLLPLKSWYPIDVDISPNYEFAFILQFFGQVFIGIGEYTRYKTCT
jgi:hypothetical protein